LSLDFADRPDDSTVVRLPLFLLVLIAPAAAAEVLTVVDIAHADAAQVERLKQIPGDGWWLEMGLQLAVIAPRAAVRAAASSLNILATFDDVDPDRLMLRARGCSEHAPEAGRLLAKGGRWELRQVAADEMQSLLLADDHAWQLVKPNTALARQYRLEPQRITEAADPGVQQVVNRIDPARWFADVQTLASWDRSSYGTTELDAARDWIATQFSTLGLSDGLQAFTMNGAGGGTITRYNVTGAWIGSSQPDRWLIVGAHYDSRNTSSSSTINTPGAEDNASGCAGVIELARALLPSQPSRSILFMCYAGEEQGLRGSAAHVQSLIQAGQLASVDAVVIMDMIGYSADANLEALYESSASNSPYLLQFGAAAATYVPQLAVITSTNPFGSDHVPYLNAGVRTALAIENDWDIYPHYHRSTDLPANMGPNAQPMGAAILKTNAAVIAEIAGLDGGAGPVFADGFEGP
jgi:hypothetical protein